MLNALVVFIETRVHGAFTLQFVETQKKIIDI